MSSIAELTAQLMVARLTNKDLSFEELQKEMDFFAAKLTSIDSGSAICEDVTALLAKEETEAPTKIDLKKIFKKDEVICLICNKGFKTLKRHLTTIHHISDKEYKIKFGISPQQNLVAKAYSDRKKADAQRNNLGAKMQAGRKAKAEAAAHN